MKVGLTSDLHLTENRIERYNSLTRILNDLKKKGIKFLIIAGDLFDREEINYSTFEKICSDFKDIQIIILPGNHDESIEQRFFSIENITVIKKPKMLNFDNVYFLLIPYVSKSSMDKEITEFLIGKKVPSPLVLIGHGDYITSGREENRYERGFYMVLTKSTVEKFSPKLVILGHIHKPDKYENIFYLGSPVPIDSTETGKRRFLIFDTSDFTVESIEVESDFLYFSEVLLSVPIKEIETINSKIDSMIKNWGLVDSELSRVRLKLKVTGYSFDRERLKFHILKYLSSRNIKLDEKDLEFDVKVVKDNTRFSIFKRFQKIIDDFDVQKICTFSKKEDVIIKAMETIFGG